MYVNVSIGKNTVHECTLYFYTNQFTANTCLKAYFKVYLPAKTPAVAFLRVNEVFQLPKNQFGKDFTTVISNPPVSCWSWLAMKFAG